jgi:hypothetical protein
MAKTTKPAARKPAAKKPAATKPAARSGATSQAAVAAAMKEFAAIQRKAKLVGSKGLDTHFDSKGDPQGAWAEVIAELDAWARKHKVKLATREQITGGGDPGAPTPRARRECPRTFSSTERFDWPGGGHTTVKTTCNLRRQTLLGRCVYGCASEVTEAVGGHL